MKLFTYGTLNGHQSSGTINGHRLMRNAESLGEAFTAKEYYKGTQSFYPYLLEKQTDLHKRVDTVQGYLWEVPEKDFKEIDQYEGSPDLFYRKEITVKSAEGDILAWCYFIDPKEI